MVHRLLLWARAKDGEHAYRLFRMLLEKTTYPNLWAAHPPFQIDANFGGTAGVAEMLLQSHAGCIELLPAIPAAWSTGSFRGLLARGGFEVDVEWRDRRIIAVRVRARNGGICRLLWRGVVRPVATPEVSLTFDPASSLLVFDTRKHEAVVVRDMTVA
jgi:alpha-L-fucosidase 2